MRVTVHAHQYELTPAIKRYVADNLQEPLEGIWQKDGSHLEVFLTDLRGAKGGLDQECRCTFRITGGRQLVITEVTEDMRTSIHQCRRRLLRRVRAYVGRKLVGPRRPRKYFLAKLENETEPRTPRHAPLPRVID
jgi:ribosome-associated translation inhibitor RaiA